VAKKVAKKEARTVSIFVSKNAILPLYYKGFRILLNVSIQSSVHERVQVH
jgi:hypothetical protein